MPFLTLLALTFSPCFSMVLRQCSPSITFYNNHILHCPFFNVFRPFFTWFYRLVFKMFLYKIKNGFYWHIFPFLGTYVPIKSCIFWLFFNHFTQLLALVKRLTVVLFGIFSACFLHVWRTCVCISIFQNPNIPPRVFANVRLQRRTFTLLTLFDFDIIFGDNFWSSNLGFGLFFNAFWHCG